MEKKNIVGYIISQVLNKLLFSLLKFRLKYRRDPPETNSVLIIRFAHIGDFIVWLDSAKEYRNLYPDKEIIYMCYQFKDVTSIAEKLPFFSRVICVNTKGLNRVKELFRLSKLNFDTIINANPSRSILSDLFVMAPNSKERYAPQTDNTCINESDINCSDEIYSRVVPCGGIETMELVRNAQFIRGLGGENFYAQVPVLPVFAQNPMAGKDYYFVVCPGAETVYQRWPKERFVEIIDYVLKKTSLICILVGTRNERVLGDSIIKLSSNQARIEMLMGETALLEYIEVIRGAEFLISNDTSAVHIAVATGVQSIVFGAGWNKGRFYPYVEEKINKSPVLPVSVTAQLDCFGCGMRGKDFKLCESTGTMACIASVSIESVSQAVDKIIERRRSMDGSKSKNNKES